MFRFGIRTLLILIAMACAVAAGIAFLIVTLRPLSPTYYARYLDVDPATYSHIDDLTALEFGDRIYIYSDNQFVNAINDCDPKPSVADENGRVPVLKFDGDTYVILRKWVNESGGLAISNDPDFASKLEQFDDDFVVQHVYQNIYHWDLDLERDSYR